MFELTPEQLRALDNPQQPVIAVDPRTGQQYRLIKEEVYKVIQGIVKPFNRGWDPDEELIRKDA